MNRRAFIRRLGFAGFGLLTSPIGAMPVSPGERRFVFIIQRGAADGLSIVIPHAEPAYAGLRGALAIDPASATPLDGTFALHPSLTETAKLYARREALFVHAVATPYRERSHFDGQNMLETGGTAPYRTRDGWLNRLAGMLPSRKDGAIAFAPTVPLALRGSVDVGSYGASTLPQPSDDLLSRVTQLYDGDAQLHALWTTAMTTRGIAEETTASRGPAGIGQLAASFLSRADGPRIAMIETGGWDTHSAQAPRLANQLRMLDATIAALRDGLGSAWQDTVVVVATEFGRTVAANGTGGTDHGTGSVAMLLGGAVQGGKVVADWPGLAPAALLEQRDLRPTADLDTLLATVAAQCFRLDPARVLRTLLPDRSTSPHGFDLVRA